MPLEYYALAMIVAFFVLVMTGIPVGFVVAFVGFVFGFIGFDGWLFELLPSRIYGVVSNYTLLAIPLFVLTMHDNEEYIRRAVACGAAGYVLKDASAEEMVFALREVASGRSHFGSSVSRVLLEEKEGRLTQRETDILKLMFEGMSSRDIGEALAISTRTVESHRSNIYRKLNTNSLAGLFRYAMRHGLVELE
ncbi:LuxR C-terminal-related transcriptional regulator [Billgrantia antri]|uniref:LuxR C-terminal-related transcriptional regulator n=1 Tax=Billgrantia antri TaxID=2846777 RepID=UPI003B210FEF